MADTNPTGTPPEPAASPIDQDILETLSLGEASTPTPAPTPASPEPPAATPVAPSEAGAAVGSAPAAPVTPPAEPAPAAPATPAAPTPPEGTPPAPAASAPAEPPAAAPPADNEAALREASLRAQVDALSRTVEELRASPQTALGATPTPTPAESGTPAEKPLRYNLTLPEATRNALLSDDPQQNLTAINAIVNDLGTIVHHTVLAQVRSEMKQAFGALISQAQQTETAATNDQARASARDAYFKAFPTHKNELIEPIIRQQALALSAEHPGAPFNEAYINALGTRVNSALEKLGAKPTEAPAEPSAPAPAPPARPAAFVPSGTRGSAAPTPAGELSDDIMGTLDPFSS